MQEISLPIQSKNLLISNRTLGVIGMIGSPMLFLASFFYSKDPNGPDSNQLFTSFCGVVYLFGALMTATAMRSLWVTGNGKGAKILYVIQIIGLFLAMWYDILKYFAPGMRETTLFFITDMAYPFSHLLMIIVGICVIRAGVWQSWRTIPAFLVGLALPFFIILSLFFGRESAGFIFPLMVTTGFFLLGFAVITTKQLTKI